ncbi:hypothetical protein KQH29_00365 [bacterium]|nr:hypothetical protein [bacterium]
MIGYGYGSGPLIEETSSAEHHYELMALARVLAEGLGLLREGQDGVSYLEEIRDRMSSAGGSVPEGLETILQGIQGELTQMRTILQAGHNASEAIRQEAQAVLDAHAEAAQNYMGQLQTQPAPDWYPFESVPAGTNVRDLESGGRLFGLPNADQVRVNADGSMVFIGADGEAQRVDPPVNRQIALPGGLVLTLRAEAVRVTHEAAMIEGLPWDATPEQVAAECYSVALPGGVRLDVNHAEHSATVINPTGTVALLSLPRIEGIGEEVEIRLIAGGAKAFAVLESGHRGIIESGGTIHLGLSNGLDLVIRFPASASPGGGDTRCDGVCGIDCQERTP